MGVVIAMVGWVGARMEMVCNRDKDRRGWYHVGRCLSTSRVRGDTMMTPDHTALQVHSCRYGLAGIGRSSWEGIDTGRNEKAQFCCPSIRLAALHGAPRTQDPNGSCLFAAGLPTDTVGSQNFKLSLLVKHHILAIDEAS